MTADRVRAELVAIAAEVVRQIRRHPSHVEARRLWVVAVAATRADLSDTQGGPVRWASVRKMAHVGTLSVGDVVEVTLAGGQPRIDGKLAA